MLQSLQNLVSGVTPLTLNIPRVGLSDILDILIVAYALFKVIVWIKETRAWSLFKGIVVLLLASAGAYLFHLTTLSWIVSNTFSVGLLAIVVLFQPELRKALEQIGNGRMLIPISISDEERDKTSEHTIDEVIKAAKLMSKARTGALILLEKDIGIGDHESTGIPIDGIVSSQLLINIFENKTPLHDGAVIIRGNRVAAATCILPLTQDEIGRELGTRHRAGVGVSEVSDAYVLIVSEETGAISVAHEGKLYRNLNEGQVKEMLMDVSESQRKRLVLWRGKHNDENRS